MLVSKVHEVQEKKALLSFARELIAELVAAGKPTVSLGFQMEMRR